MTGSACLRSKEEGSRHATGRPEVRKPMPCARDCNRPQQQIKQYRWAKQQFGKSLNEAEHWHTTMGLTHSRFSCKRGKDDVMTADHRLTDRLTNYWNLIRKDAVMPEFAHFNMSALSDIWQQCILFTVQPAASGSPASVSFYMLGDQVKSIYGDMSGRTMHSGMKHFQGASIVRRMDEVIASPQIILDQGQFVNDRSKIVKYRSCLLPFGKDGKVTHVLAGLSWREF